MSNIDERVVSMQFNNKQFEDNAKVTMSTMDKLKASLDFDGVKDGLEDLSKASDDFTLDGIGESVDGIASKFGALSILGITALVNIGNKAVDMGLQMVKALTIEPIMAGFSEYELKMGSIQTILANTAKYGTQLSDVTGALDQLNEYADKTIYNFGDMTKNIGLFTNAGIRIEDATSMIKGFSNAAAASGTSAEGASGAAYQLSQALSNGKVTLMDWKSLTNVGMGNKNMQDGIIQIAQAMGTFDGTTTDATSAGANFNASLEAGWLSADVMSSYLKIMAGDMDDAAMSAMGLSSEQIAGFKATQVTAEEAATKVRTWTQLYGTLKEAVGSSWTDSFAIIIGDFDEATSLFTNISNTVGGIIGSMGNARNAMLQGWKDSGGRQDLLDIGTNLWKSLTNVIAPIKDAWAKIFPPDGGSALKGFTGGIKTVTEVIAKITSGLTALQPVFEVVFGIFKIAMSIVQGLAKYMVSLFAIIGGVGTGSILGMVGGFAALVAKAIEFVNTGKYVEKFFTGLASVHTAVLAPMIDFLNRIVEAFKLLVKGDTAGFFDGIKGSVQAFAPLIDMISTKIQSFSTWIQNLGTYFGVLGDKGNSAFGTIGSLLSKASGYLSDFAQGFKGVADILTKGDFVGASKTFRWMEDSKAVDVLFKVRDALVGVKGAGDQVIETASNVGSKFSGVSSTGEEVTTIWERISNAFSAVVKFLAPAVSAVGGFLSWIGTNVKRVIEDLSGQDMLALINTGLFMAAYLSVKKFMDSFRTMFDSAAGTFESIGGVFDGLTEHLKTMQNDVKANILIKIAIAIALLAASVWVLSKISIGDLTAATVAIIVLMKALMDTMDSFAESMATTETGKIMALGVTLMFVGVAILLLSAALKIFASMSWEELAKGVVTLAVVLKVLTMALDAIPEKDLVRNAAALMIIAVAMQLFALAILAFSAMDIGTVGEGLAYIAGALLVLTAAMNAMPEKSMLKNAATMMIMSAALQVFALAILSFSAMDAGQFFEGLGYIAAGLAVLAIGMAAMSGAMSGAVALVVVSAALIVLAHALGALGALDLPTVGKALLIIIGVIALFAGASMLLAPVIPIMVALGIAMALLGAAMMLAGAGMMLFSMAFAALAVSGVAGAAGFTAAMMAILELLPLMAQQLGLAVLAFAVVISEGGPAIVAALVTLLLSLIAAITEVIPPFIEMIIVFLMGFMLAVQTVTPEFIKTTVILIKAVVNAIVDLVPFLVDAGLKLLRGLIKGFDDNLPSIIESGKNLIINFIRGIGSAALDITEAALETILTFIEGLASAIRRNSPKINAAGLDLADAIVDGIVDGLKKGVSAVVEGAKSLVKGIPGAIKNVLGIASPSKVTTKLGEQTGDGVAVGLDNMGRVVYKAAMGTGEQAVQGMKKGLSNASDITTKDINLNPVIRPVLDLTDVEAGAKRIENMMSAEAISVETSSNSAQAISASAQDAQDAQDAQAVSGAPIAFSFTQNNTSPKALSNIEIYRQTHNQISAAKGALTP